MPFGEYDIDPTDHHENNGTKKATPSLSRVEDVEKKSSRQAIEGFCSLEATKLCFFSFAIRQVTFAFRHLFYNIPEAECNK